MSDLNKKFADKAAPAPSVPEAYFKDFMDDAKDFPTLRQAVAAGSNIDAKQNGTTALMMAAVYGDEEGAKLLIGLGADTLVTDSSGRTAQDIAVETYEALQSEGTLEVGQWCADIAQYLEKPAKKAQPKDPRKGL